MLFEIVYTVSSLFYIISIIYILIRMKHAVTVAKKEEIRKEIMEFMESEEMAKIIIKAFNDSEINKKLNEIVLILCTQVPELKRSKLCEGEI